MVILKVAKNQGFTLSLEDTLLEKPQTGGGSQINPANLFRVKRLYLTVLKLRSIKKDSKNFHHLI